MVGCEGTSQKAWGIVRRTINALSQLSDGTWVLGSKVENRFSVKMPFFELLALGLVFQ